MGRIIFSLFLGFAIATLINEVFSDKSSIKMKKGAPHIQLPYGLLAGTVKESRNGRDYYSFMGVRYANPPRRFEASSILNQTWKSVKPAHQPGAKCPQHSWLAEEMDGNEDCLFCNIHIPIKPLLEKTLPVIVWIHGGGFYCGESHSYGADYFMDQDVILVTINYRLGAFGFLSTEDGVIPGNNGLRDQLVALQFIQKNIAAFGGDPSRVTIFGNSAGSVSVHYLILSPLAKGLFRNAISSSGTTLNPWARIRHPLERAKKLGESLVCPTKTSFELAQCLRNRDAKDIILHSKKILTWNNEPLVLFGPTFEKTNKDFLPDTPENLIESGNYNEVPLILGVTENEGFLKSIPTLLNEKVTQELNDEWNTYAPQTFVYEDLFKKEDLQIISDKIRQFYFGDKPVGISTRDNLTNLYSDSYFVYGTYKAALTHTRKVPVYLYLNTYFAQHTVTTLFGFKENLGATHGDDLQMNFKTEYFGPPITKESLDYEFSENLVKLWASFATDGKPTKTWDDVRKWEPLSRKGVANGKPMKWLNIDTKTTMVKEPFLTRMQFWDDLFQNYANENYHRDEL